MIFAHSVPPDVMDKVLRNLSFFAKELKNFHLNCANENEINSFFQTKIPQMFLWTFRMRSAKKFFPKSVQFSLEVRNFF